MMKFDHVVMNPPYSGNLHLKVLQEALRHSDDIVNLSPIRWLQDPSASYKEHSDFNAFPEIRQRIESIDVITAKDATSSFGATFWNDLAVYHFTKEGGLDTASFWETTFQCLPAVRRVITEIGIPVYAEKTKPSILSCFGIGSDRPYWITCPRVHGHIGKSDQFDIVAPDIKWALNVPDKEGKCVYFETEEEARHFFATLKSKLYRFIKRVGFFSTANVFTGLPWLEDYTHPWTDTDLYAHFNFTPEEIATIEEDNW